MSKCEYCPAGWEDRSYEGECNDYGCIIMGHEYCNDNCSLSKATVKKRLQEWEDYTSGKIERPKWVENKFFREMDQHRGVFGSLGIFLPGFPPKRMTNGCHDSLYSADGLRDQSRFSYRHGYNDALEGRPMQEDF